MRNYDGAYVSVGEEKTDSSGLTSFYLISGQEYRVKAEYQGVVSYVTITAQATTYDLRVYESIAFNFTSLFNDISIRILPFGNLERDENDDLIVTFNFSITSENSTLEMFGMRLLCDGNKIFEQNVTTSPSGGEIYTTQNVTSCSNVTLVYYFKKAEHDMFIGEKIYYVIISYLRGLNRALEDFKAQLPEDQQILLVVLILAVVGVGLSLWNPEAAALGIISVGGFFVYKEILDFSLYIIMVLVMLSVMMIRRRWL